MSYSRRECLTSPAEAEEVEAPAQSPVQLFLLFRRPRGTLAASGDQCQAAKGGDNGTNERDGGRAGTETNVDDHGQRHREGDEHKEHLGGGGGATGGGGILIREEEQ